MRELRTTTGQTIDIRYEPATNTMLIIEDDWFADPVRASAVPPRGMIRIRSGVAVPAATIRPRRRSAAMPAGQPGSPGLRRDLHLVS